MPRGSGHLPRPSPTLRGGSGSFETGGGQPPGTRARVKLGLEPCLSESESAPCSLHRTEQQNPSSSFKETKVQTGCVTDSRPLTLGPRLSTPRGLRAAQPAPQLCPHRSPAHLLPSQPTLSSGTSRKTSQGPWHCPGFPGTLGTFPRCSQVHVSPSDQSGEGGHL